MARSRGIIGGVVAGAQTILGRLAQWFGLGQAGSVQTPLVPQPGRPELATPAEIVAAIAAERLTPTAAMGNRVSRSYLCEWYDTDSGDVYGKTRVQVETAEGVATITATTQARQAARMRFVEYIVHAVPEGAHVSMRCRQLGRPIIIPASG